MVGRSSAMVTAGVPVGNHTDRALRPIIVADDTNGKSATGNIRKDPKVAGAQVAGTSPRAVESCPRKGAQRAQDSGKVG